MSVPRPKAIKNPAATNAELQDWLGNIIVYAAYRGIDISIFPSLVTFLDGTAKANWVVTDENRPSKRLLWLLGAYIKQGTQTPAHPRKFVLSRILGMVYWPMTQGRANAVQVPCNCRATGKNGAVHEYQQKRGK
ncbi:hypothetical protein GGX14DRAFT_405652 [Mycena pura]|uniref:Uncharacterized protein n=1 Tax=Mycena pura TaxID=153505 RepID=A0AAD6UYP1_9AGAR|nr:hypothetical protein GGX14DRAFT_405652 [Mycena pura]